MTKTKMFLWILAVPFILLQSYWTFAPDIGIIDRYGIVGGFTEYYPLNQGNSLLMAGFTDFMMVNLIRVVWMTSETPPERRWAFKFFFWLLCFIVFPGLGFLVFFLFLNPDHRFVADKK